MYAMVGVFKMDTRHFDRQKQELDERIVPMVRHQPGFVSAIWSYDREAGRSFSVVAFDTENAARQLATLVKERTTIQNDAGVQLESITVAEVIAEARR